MFDRQAQTLLHPALNAAARGLVRAGISADTLTWLGFAIGMAAAVAIALQAWWWGLVLLLASRLLDGLDGSVARLTQPTDAGGFLDIALDFLFYAAIPLAFAVANPATNALPAACPAGQLHRYRQQLFGVCRTGRKTRPERHRLAGQKLLLLGRPDRSHRDHHRLCRHVRVA